MKKGYFFFLLLIILFSIANSTAQRLMIIEMKCSADDGGRNTFTIGDIILRNEVNGYTGIGGQTGYNLNFYGAIGNQISSAPVILPGEAIAEGPEDPNNPESPMSGVIIPPCASLEGQKFVVVAPYAPNAVSASFEQTISGFPVPIVLAQRSLYDVADLCGDGLCQKAENAEFCLQDCFASSIDGLCQNEINSQGISDGICDPDCLNMAPDTAPFILDSDCVPASLSNLPCDGSTGCYSNSVFSCYFDKLMQKHYIRKFVCDFKTGERCSNGVCTEGLNIINNYICKANRDCIVNGAQWVCSCGKCRKPGTFSEGRCCFENPF